MKLLGVCIAAAAISTVRGAACTEAGEAKINTCSEQLQGLDIDKILDPVYAEPKCLEARDCEYCKIDLGGGKSIGSCKAKGVPTCTSSTGLQHEGGCPQISVDLTDPCVQGAINCEMKVSMGEACDGECKQCTVQDPVGGEESTACFYAPATACTVTSQGIVATLGGGGMAGSTCPTFAVSDDKPSSGVSVGPVAGMLLLPLLGALWV